MMRKKNQQENFENYLDLLLEDEAISSEVHKELLSRLEDLVQSLT